MTPAAIIATAWAAERDQHVISREYGDEYTVQDKVTSDVEFSDTHAACQAHLDQLCATAVLTAIREAEAPFRDQVRAEVQAFVNAYAGPKTVAFFARRMEAMLAAAPPLGER